jgi:peroxiredoxin
MSTRDRASVLLAAAGLAALAFAILAPPSAFLPVTDSMRAAARLMAGRRVTDLSAVGSDGRAYSPASEASGRPLVLVFIKDGCPCSESAEPYFQRLHAAYGARASFLGVIDADPSTARDWASRHATPYPVLSDPDLRIVSACSAERSAYVMLVAPGGSVAALWPGFSAPMLSDVGARLARLTGQDEVSLDTTGAPAELASGCLF